MVSLHVEHPALNTSIFFIIAHPFVDLLLAQQSGITTDCGHAFHADATTSNPTAKYIANFDSHQNFPTNTPAPAMTPSTNGANPCRRFARNASAATAITRKAAVIGNRYLAEIRNPNPTEPNKPA
jgi:hypothetical protein